MEIDCDQNFKELDFESLPDGFDMATVVAVLKIVCGYSQHWEEYYDGEGLIDAAKHAIENAGDMSEIYPVNGAAVGASIVRNSIVDDWNSFVSKTKST